MTAPLLDTHAWVWWVTSDRRLGEKTRRRLDQLPADRRPLLSAISLWEVATLVSLGRLTCRPSFDAWVLSAADSAVVQVLPITPAIAMEVLRLPEAFRRDPGDRLIVATARVHDLRVVTTDRTILGSKLVKPWHR